MTDRLDVLVSNAGIGSGEPAGRDRGVGGQHVGADRMQAFIFVTAHAEYAVRAFEIDAVDYLCKPFDRQRLAVAVQRARRHLERPSAAAAVLT